MHRTATVVTYCVVDRGEVVTQNYCNSASVGAFRSEQYLAWFEKLDDRWSDDANI
jgi:hypothetical protein